MIKQRISKIKKTRKKIIKWKDRICMKTDKKEIKRSSIKNKSFEKLILEKDEQNNYVSIRIPIFISIAGMVIGVIFSAFSSLITQIGGGNNKVILIIFNALKYIFGAAYIVMFIRMLNVIKNILEEQDIISKNIKAYDEEIFERLEKQEKAKMTLLEDIRDNTKHKTKK